jgi:DNA-binding transcriptional MerR regulator
MATQEPIRKRTSGPGSGTGSGQTREIPDKLYFRIGEVAKLCEVPAYVLRFWEGEFPQLKPNKGGTGQRLFRRRDVEMALRIKTLLYDEGYTIPGARQAFKTELRSSKDPQAAPPTDRQSNNQSVDLKHIQTFQKELSEIHALLSKPATSRAVGSRNEVQSIRPTRHKQPAPEPTLTPIVQFPKPKSHPKLRDTMADSFVHGLFDDLPPLK